MSIRLCCIFMLLPFTTAAGQRLPPPLPTAGAETAVTPLANQVPTAARTARATVGAALLRGLGLSAGVFICSLGCNDLDCLGGVIGLGLTGEIIGVVAGTHWGNSRRGDLRIVVPVAIGTVLGGLAVFVRPDHDDQLRPFYATAALQISATVAAELLTSYRKRQAR